VESCEVRQRSWRKGREQYRLAGKARFFAR